MSEGGGGGGGGGSVNILTKRGSHQKVGNPIKKGIQINVSIFNRKNNFFFIKQIFLVLF